MGIVGKESDFLNIIFVYEMIEFVFAKEKSAAELRQMSSYLYCIAAPRQRLPRLENAKGLLARKEASDKACNLGEGVAVFFGGRFLCSRLFCGRFLSGFAG